MNPDTLANWRDAATILLTLEVFVFALVLLFLSYFAIRGLRLVRARLAHYLSLGQRYIQQTEQVTRRASKTVVDPTTRIISTIYGVRTAVHTALSRDEHI